MMRIRSRQQNPYRATRGVALLEVLLSVIIIGIGFGASFKMISSATRTQSRIEQKALVRRLAESELVRLRLTGGLSQPGVTEGRFVAGEVDYSWRARIQGGPGNSPFNLVDFVVFRGQDKDRVYSIQTLSLAP